MERRGSIQKNVVLVVIVHVGDDTVVEDVEMQAQVDLTPAVEGGQTTAAEPVEIEVRGTQGTGTLEQDTNRLTEYRIPSYSKFKVYSMYSEAFCMLPLVHGYFH